MSYKYAFFFLDCQILMLDLQKIDCSHIFRFPEYCLIRKKNIPLLRLFPTRYCMRETKHRDSRHRYQECTYRRREMGKSQRSHRHFGSDPRCRLVRPPTRSLQADTQRQRRSHTRSTRRDHRLFGYDPLGRYGIGNSSG